MFRTGIKVFLVDLKEEGSNLKDFEEVDFGICREIHREKSKGDAVEEDRSVLDLIYLVKIPVFV